MSLDVYLEDERSSELFWRNITHNLNIMAGHANLYLALWRPEEIPVATAAELAPLLEAGLAKLREEPDRFRALNPANGWGKYEGLVEFVEAYLAACRQHPSARVWVSR